MNIKRFHAATSREALAKARMAFGEGTLILSNRATANGVEVVATAEDSLEALEAQDLPEGEPSLMSQQHAPSSGSGQPLPREMSAPVPASRKNTHTSATSAASAANIASDESVEDDTEALAMSTLSFQDYVRERMLRRRHEALHAEAAPAPAAVVPAKAPAPQPHRPPNFADRARDHAQERTRDTGGGRGREPVLDHAPSYAAAPTPARGSSASSAGTGRGRAVQHPEAASHAQGHGAAGMTPQGLMHELNSVKELIEDRFNTLAWLGQARQNPTQSNLMVKLIRAGYSPTLARAVLERLPEDLSAADAVRWLMDVLERNLKTDAPSRQLHEEGGVFALVGATGVGKTTTTAKLAALCARHYGPGSVGLITLDTYRIGAHEQLRTFGRMLGVVAHLAHDRAALQDLLGLLSGKKMVLIDTSGVAPRDQRMQETLEILELPSVQRLLVLNAGSHGDTLDDVIDAFKGTAPQQAVLSKVDEAIKLGPALDALIRHQVVLRGVANGQRVPEDWTAASAAQLIAHSMRAPAKSAFDPKPTELNFFFASGSDKGLSYA